jgi:hypothetical protein
MISEQELQIEIARWKQDAVRGGAMIAYDIDLEIERQYWIKESKSLLQDIINREKDKR